MKGADDVQYTYIMMSRLMSSMPDSVDPHTLKPLRQFRWCLKLEQNDAVHQWNRIVVNRVGGNSAKAWLSAEQSGELVECVATSSSSCVASAVLVRATDNLGNRMTKQRNTDTVVAA